ncbi:MAG: HAMP domain-containing histidine kinase [Hyphomicrobiaceae bacterium]|nr:MAG: HAMP domain-containing histidine kinase [Hyphomicrobiaceae bacterium]
MTPGTSPRPCGTPSSFRADVGKHIRDRAARLKARAQGFGRHVPWLMRAVAALHLAGLGLIMTTAWAGPGAAGSGPVAGLPGLHLAFLMATGAAAALLIMVAGHDRDMAASRQLAAGAGSAAGLTELMAQMSHELRTPLNAVIGFSEVMLHELHGPLGHARYQEYAHHISESGGRLLKTSEDALAVTEALSALIADRMHNRRERLVAAPLVREAWRAAGGASAPSRLVVTTCTTCDIVCERRATSQALEHLLREALAKAPAEGRIEVRGTRRGGRRSLEIRVADAQAAAGTEGPGSLCLILARLLLETQGAGLACKSEDDGVWSATIEFSARS